MQLPETVCARARESVSAQLDGELSAHELDHVENHLLICPECSAWAEQVRGLTARLREVTLEVPAERFGLSRRRASWRVGSAVAVTSAAALVATMFFAPGRQGTLGAARSATRSSVRFTGHEVPGGRVLEDGVFVAVSVNTQNPSFRPV
jgi:predicted anti-sigma-YlaC factor YlaD